MTFQPFTSGELARMRKQRQTGWSIAGVAKYWGREPAEVDLMFWIMLGRWSHITNGREAVNRRMAKRAALTALPSELAAA